RSPAPPTSWIAFRWCWRPGSTPRWRHFSRCPPCSSWCSRSGSSPRACAMSERRAAAAMGALFLVATASYVAGSQLLDRGRLAGGALFVLVDALAVVGIAVLAFPILRRTSDAIALFHLALRILEAALLLVGAVGALSGIERSNYWAYQLAMAVLGPGG